MSGFAYQMTGIHPNKKRRTAWFVGEIMWFLAGFHLMSDYGDNRGLRFDASLPSCCELIPSPPYPIAVQIDSNWWTRSETMVSIRSGTVDDVPLLKTLVQEFATF